MNKEELKEKFAGESYPTVTGTQIPKDSVSLEALAAWAESVEERLEGKPGREKGLKDGVKVTANGKYMLNGKFVKEGEAYL